MLSLLVLMGSALAGGFGNSHGSEARQAKTLGDAASDYWEGVRWNDSNKAGKYLPEMTTRLSLTQMLAEPGVHLTDATVIQVELGTTPKDKGPRPAVAMIRLEIVDVAKNRYDTLTYVQHWQAAGSGWQVDEAQSPLGTDRPWVLPQTP